MKHAQPRAPAISQHARTIESTRLWYEMRHRWTKVESVAAGFCLERLANEFVLGARACSVHQPAGCRAPKLKAIENRSRGMEKSISS